jgi:hypothetical protein
MSADPRLICLRLGGGWASKVDRGELELANAWDLLLERVSAEAKKFQACDVCGMRPCPDTQFCDSMRAADQKSAASRRRCAQCGGTGGPLDPHPDSLGHRLIYLHRECKKFWEARRR